MTMEERLKRRAFLTLSGTASISPALRSKQSSLSLQERWLDLAKRIKERCQGWLIPNFKTLSYRITIATDSLSGEAKVFYRTPNTFRIEQTVKERGQPPQRHVHIFRDGELWWRKEGEPFQEISMGLKSLTFLRGVEVQFGLDEALKEPERVKAEAILEKDGVLQITLTKPDGFFYGYMCLGLQHFIRSFATSLKGSRLTLWLYEETLQPLTEVLWHEQGDQPTLKVLSIVGYKDFRDSAVPRLVEMTAVVDGWEWRNRLEFEWVKRKAWLLKKGEAWGEFLTPGLMKAKAEVSEVNVDKPLPDTLFEIR